MTTPTGILFSEPRDKPLSATGQFQAGSYRYFYTTGTLVQTPIYSDGGLTTPLSQPVTAAADGRFPAIYLNPATTYRCQLYNAANVLLDDTDPYLVIGSGSQLPGGLGLRGNAPPAQITGWGTPTGAAVQNNYSGSSATLLQTSQAVAEIITILKAFGLFGA